MTNLRKIHYQRIYLFENKTSDHKSTNTLRDFINLTKQIENSKIIDFAYSGETNTIHSSISLKENFIIDAIPNSLEKLQDHGFNIYLKGIKNPHLKKLLLNAGDLERSPTEFSQRELIIANFGKALLSNSKNIFLDIPKKGVSAENINFLKEAILFEVEINHKNVMVQTFNQEYWVDIASHFVLKERTTFKILLNPLKELENKKNQFEPTYNFSLKKSKIA